MPLFKTHPAKDRLRLIAVEWKKKKLDGGIITAAGLEGGRVSAAGLEGGRVSAAGLEGGRVSAAGIFSKRDFGGGFSDLASKKKAQNLLLKEELGPSMKKHSKPKAIGGFLTSLKLEIPDDMKDSHSLTKKNSKKLLKHVEETLGKKLASQTIKSLKHVLDSVKQ